MAKNDLAVLALVVATAVGCADGSESVNDLDVPTLAVAPSSQTGQAKADAKVRPDVTVYPDVVLASPEARGELLGVRSGFKGDGERNALGSLEETQVYQAIQSASVPPTETDPSRSSGLKLPLIGLLTPGPTYAFSTVAPIDHPDVNVAASHTHICVTTRDAIGCFSKAGVPVSLGANLQPGWTFNKDVFQAANPSFVPRPINTCSGSFTKDARIVFDQAFQRFFFVAMTREAQGRLLIMTSKSQDPQDGWFTLADDVVVGSDAFNGFDYEIAGVSASNFLVTVGAAKGCTQQCLPDPTCANSNNGCVLLGASTCVPDQSQGQPLVTLNLAYSSSGLRNGTSVVRTAWTANFSTPSPAVNVTYSTDAYYVSRDDDATATVWTVRAGGVNNLTGTIISSPQPNRASGPEIGDLNTCDNSMPGGGLPYDQFGRRPMNAEFRSGKLTWSSNDGFSWFPFSTNDEVRMVQFDVSHIFDSVPWFSTVFDRQFEGDVSSDPPNIVFDSGFPGIATNSLGDVVVGTLRSSCTTYAQQRAAVKFAGEYQFRESTLLAYAQDVEGEYDMAGVAADASTTGVYLAQISNYGCNPSPCVPGAPLNRFVRVVKMLGTTLPDVVPAGFGSTQTSFKLNGSYPGFVVRVLNQGDASVIPSLGSTTSVILSKNSDLSQGVVVGTLYTPAASAGGVAIGTVTLKMPTDVTWLGAGYLGTNVDSNFRLTEHSKTNNQNPQLAAPHGNVPVNITLF